MNRVKFFEANSAKEAEELFFNWISKNENAEVVDIQHSVEKGKFGNNYVVFLNYKMS